jgi:hypothetical protein
MKKLILLIAVVFMISSSYAQVLTFSDVPANISKAFVKSHPKVTTVEWAKAGDNFKANYVVDSTDRSVTYNTKGKITETEKQVSVASLPTLAIKYVNENFKDGYVKRSTQITNSKGKVTYNVKIKDVVLTFDSNGKYLKPTV